MTARDASPHSPQEAGAAFTAPQGQPRSAEGPAPGQLDKGAQLSPSSALTAKPTLFPSPTPRACT